MYNIGELIVYGSAGVYRVEDIKALSGISCAEKGRKYYVLKPVFGDGVVYYPVDSGKIFTRPIISKAEAEELIDAIPDVKGEAITGASAQELSEHYKNTIKSHDCADLISLLISIYSKKQCAEEQKKKIGQIDETFMKQAENQLYSEFGAALGIPKGDVPEYIKKRVGED